MGPDDLGIPQLSEVARVGSGGYSDVFVAHHETLGRRVAIKMIRRLDDPQQLAAFQHECASMGRLSDHPNVVVPLSAGTTADGRHYLLLEFYPDGSCADLVANQGPLGAAGLSSWLAQVGGALQAAHHRGIVHNDVKPANILVRRSPDGVRYAVTDFGLAQAIDGHTASANAAGSLLYVAPELLDGSPSGPASDVYGLAAAACFMACGVPPIRRRRDESWLSLVRRVAEEPPDPAVIARIPEPLDAAVVRALAKSPEQRTNLDQLLYAATQVGISAPSHSGHLLVRPAATRHELPGAPQDPAAADESASASAEPAGHDHPPGFRVWQFVLLLIALFVVSMLVGQLLR